MSERHMTGRYGRFGGRFVAEALWTPLQQVKEAFEAAVGGGELLADFDALLDSRVGRPTPLTHLRALSAQLGGAQLWLKREDLCVGGNFTTNLAAAYALLARRMGRQALVGETATGEFGAALASMGNALGLKARVYMGREDHDAEPLGVQQMQALGAEIVTVDASLRGRKNACSEALRYWATHSDTHFYSPSSLAAPDPYPSLGAYFLSAIGHETRLQVERLGFVPEYVVAPVGGGGFAAGLFGEFIGHDVTQLVGVQGAGEGLSGRHAASIVGGRPGVFQGTFSFLLQDEDGQVLGSASAAGGLSVPVVGPQHANWAEQGLVHYVAVEDADAYQAVQLLAEREGVLISLEAGHALAYALKLLPTLRAEQSVLVGVSGSGVRDLGRWAAYRARTKDAESGGGHE